MIVVDASVLSNALAYADERGARARAVLARDPEWAAPEHWKAEVFSVLRGLALVRKIDPAVGERGVGRIPRLGIETVPLDLLVDAPPLVNQHHAGDLAAAIRKESLHLV